MSRLYGPVHRALQDRFDTRRLADSPKSLPSIRRSLKAATCSFCRPLIIRAAQLCPIRAAIPGLFVLSIVRPSSFLVTMATACSIRWVICSGISRLVALYQL